MAENTSERQLNIIIKLAELEKSIGRLYDVYTSLFPGHQHFWSSLAREEEIHARIIGELYLPVIRNETRFDERSFNLPILERFISYIEEEAGKALRQERTFINALSISLYIEESLIEQKYFSFVEASTNQIKQVLDRLAADSRRHAWKVREEFNEHKKS